MENQPSIRRREDESLEGSTVQRSPQTRTLGGVPIVVAPNGLGVSGVGSTVSTNKPELNDDVKTVIRRVDIDSAGKPAAVIGAGSPASVASVLLGTQLNHFLLEEMVGGGGMGAVFRARDERLDRVVAVKVIPFVGEDQDLQRRFRNEAQNAARLDHPYIARVFDVGRFEQWHYIVFEHVEGINLRDMVARDGVLPIDDAVYYSRQIAEAIEHASGRGIVHRDIKPSNVLVGTDGNVKVVDMGLARSQQFEVSGDMTASGVTLGTFDYISPEQARDPRDADVRSDIYSLGCTLYYLLTASPPYPGGTMLQKLLSHGSSPPPDPRELRHEVSDDLTAIIHKMLAKDPKDRYPRAIDVVADLRELAFREGLLRAQSRGTLTVAPIDPLSPILARHLPWIIAAALLLMSAMWLQMISSVSRDDFDLTAPPAAAALLSETALPFNASEPQNSAVAGSGDIAEKLAVGSTIVPPTVSPTLSTNADAAAPPSYAELAMPSDVARSAVRTADRVSPPPVPIDRIVVGTIEPQPSTKVVTTLVEAVRLADELGVDRIDIAEPVITSLPIKINRDGLTISSTTGHSEIRFVTGESLSMQRVAMLDIGSHPIEFQNLHLSWSVRGTLTDGGSLLSVAANRLVRLANCTITIENLTQRDEVYAIEVTAAGVYGAPTDTIASTGIVDSGAKLLTGIESVLAPSTDRSAEKTLIPPLVAIEMENVAVRGEMTMINLLDAVQLQFQWDNGLLAVSRRMLEANGANVKPSLTANRIQLSFNRVTAFTREGLMRMRLGPSGAYPLQVDRDSRQSVFHCEPTASLIEFTGLDSSVLDAGQLVQLRGEDNAYDFDLVNDPAVLLLSRWNGQEQVFRLSDLLAPEKPAWSADRSPRWVVRWTKPIPSEIPPSRLQSSQFLQDGTAVPGFDRNLLPAFPAKSATSEI